MLLPAGAADNYATVFIYHRFGDPRYPTTSVSMEDFERELRYLKKYNYNTITVAELYKIVSSGRPIPPKTVVITIDDGYRTTYKAFKLLKKYRIPATVFLYMEAVGRYPDFLTEKQIEEMKRSGLIEFENHLYSHPNLGLLRLKLPKEEYLRVLRREERLSRQRFKKLIGREPRFLAFPYGDYDRLSVEFFLEKGYKLLFTQDRGSYGGRGKLVPRMAIVGSQSGFRKFVRDLEIEPLPVEKAEPGYGVLKENPVRLSFWVKNPEKFKRCSIYASGLGWMGAERKGNRVETAKAVTLVKRKTRVGLRCWNAETGRKAEYFYLVLVKRPGRHPAQ
ncbi:polysaccharide deacetylase [Thermovibrio ammonificans HB-1]|uniref:Polysaccharide deacetylase n=1 Tax=Thermovibrio ammonificans (strain DSM 15698 / JCM 12110 / HB-1) TaxID=648996 RepID=E8T6B1_THEA1|nr:polysaccharide deacetylase family protein [Thermovibrio ammonificans]ADU96695.1 polysaccharide deacetylase [Thermovibrio ammonificans HB-1]